MAVNVRQKKLQYSESVFNRFFLYIYTFCFIFLSVTEPEHCLLSVYLCTLLPRTYIYLFIF